jgi:hypothetical protein
LKGISSDRLISLDRYPPPFDKGFTNIIFNVKQRTSFMDHPIPNLATLEVFWISYPAMKYEMIHRFTITATGIEKPPAESIPFPEITGIAAVADIRLATTNGPILMQYLATNQLRGSKDLVALPSYNEALQRSLTLRPTPALRGIRPSYFWLLAGVLCLTFAGIYLGSRANSRRSM